MGILRKILLILFVVFAVSNKSLAASGWVNDLRSFFQSNGAVIYGVNIRTFGANDINNNGIIEEDLGEESGNFVNAIGNLNVLAASGINTIHLLPITAIGKTKALGTAGSLYAVSSFDELNPQLQSRKSNLSLENQFSNFVEECHKRKMRVIVELPACASYDLYQESPELFKKGQNNSPITPANWPDLRLLDAGTEKNINSSVYNLYQSFIDYMVDFDVDGVMVDSASIKPAAFWKKLIASTRAVNPQFLFLAESEKSKESSLDPAAYTSTDALLGAGFDGYNGGYASLKDWNCASDLISHVYLNIAKVKRHSEMKSSIGDFAMRNDLSPILANGIQYCNMIIWLNSTLPLNPYYLDGFITGDTYLYSLINKKAPKSFTDDNRYFVNRGKMDIFNFSRSPQGKYKELVSELFLANSFREFSKPIVAKGTFSPLRTSSSRVFAYQRSFDGKSFIVTGNLDFQNKQKVTVYQSKINKKTFATPIRISSIPEIGKGKITTELKPGEVQVLYFEASNSK